MSGRSGEDAKPQVSPETPHSQSSRARPKGCGQRGQRDKTPGVGCDLDCYLEAEAPLKKVGSARSRNSQRGLPSSSARQNACGSRGCGPTAHPQPPAAEGPADSHGPGPLGVLPLELLWPCPPCPPMARPPPGPAHVLGSVLAGLLGGQLPDQQGLQELAHEAEVLVEGMEGVLRESRQSGGQTDRQTAEQQASRGRLTGGQGRRDSWARISGLFSGHRTSPGVSLAREPPWSSPALGPCQPGPAAPTTRRLPPNLLGA